MHAIRKVWMGGLVSLLVMMAVAATPAARAAEPMRVLPPTVDINDDPLVTRIASFLNRRLADAPDVEAVTSDRASALASIVRSAAYDYTAEQEWAAFSKVMTLDAMVSVRRAGAQQLRPRLGVIVTVLKDGKRTDMPDPYLSVNDVESLSMPQAASKLGQSVAAALGLPPRSTAVMTEIRIPTNDGFVTAHRTFAYPVISQNRALSETGSTLNPDDPALKSTELDQAALKLAVGVIGADFRNRSPSLIHRAYLIGRAAMFNLLGTKFEAAIYPFAALEPDDYSKYDIRPTRSLLRDVAEPLRFGGTIGSAHEDLEAFDDIENMLADDTVGGGAVMDTPSMVSSRMGTAKFTRAQQLSALRLLGVMRDPEAMPLLEQVAKRDDAELRLAAAFALGRFTGDTGIEQLETLRKDADSRVAFLAGVGLAHRDRKVGDLTAEAATMLDQPAPLTRFAADILLERQPNTAMLKRLQQYPDADVRHQATRLLADAGSASGSDRASSTAARLTLLTSADAATVIAAATTLPTDTPADSPIWAQLMQLTLDVNANVAWAARDALAPHRPSADTDAAGAARFDLDTGHLYVRHRTVRALATSPAAYATELLTQAAQNAEPHTRAEALTALAARDVDRARPLLAAALRDAHLYVRLHAAALLATHATSAEASAIREAMPQQSDVATLLYLDDALALATGKPLPASQPAARSVAGRNNLAWLCGAGAAGTSEGAINSPYQAYYMLGLKVNDGWKRVYENTNKIYIGRATPIADPGPIVVDPVAQEEFWLTLDSQLNENNLPWLDGVLYGEESMQMSPGRIWGDAWRVFCIDAGIDPKRVAGNPENLTTAQQQAWKDWAMHRMVEGFNKLYDYTKLKYGKIRPGFQVATFLGEQGLWEGPNTADFQWKFDIGGVYHYFGDTRKTAYALVRRYKTIWPSRPVIWLSNGIGVYERTPIYYDHQAPTDPVNKRWWRAYVDASAAWMAGADTGWFSIWGFMDKDRQGGGISNFKGPTITPEEIGPNTDLLTRCINHLFGGVQEMIETEQAIQRVAAEELGLNTRTNEVAIDDMVDELEGDPDAPPADADEKKQKHRLFIGFHYYRDYLFDIARMFQALPRQNYHAQSLVVHPIQNVWYGSLDSPGADLPSRFDFFIDINKIQHMDLSQYKFIAVQDPDLLQDETIDALTTWLRDTPGMLYVHQDLTPDNTRERGRIGDLDGQLQRDWPWEKDIKAMPAPSSLKEKGKVVLHFAGRDIPQPRSVIGRIYDTSADPAMSTIVTASDKPVVVQWRSTGYRGAVLFDGVAARWPEHGRIIQEHLNTLADEGIGMRFDKPLRHLYVEGDGYKAAMSTHGYARDSIEGVEAFSGDINPTHGSGSRASIVVDDIESKYLAAGNGVTVLSSTPLMHFEKIDGGVIVEAAGLIRVATGTGAVDIQTPQGELPAIADEQRDDWLLFQSSPGVITLPAPYGEVKTEIHVVRAKGRITLLVAEAPDPADAKTDAATESAGK